METTENQIVTSNFFKNELPDLSKAKVAPLELTGEYWTPEKEGETKRMFFNEIRQETAIDIVSGKDVELAVAYFVEVQDGNKKIIRQAGKRLIGALETCKVVAGMPLEITYLGKKKNKTNSFMSDSWSIKPLYIDGQEVKYEDTSQRVEREKETDANKDTIGFDGATPGGDSPATVQVDNQTGEVTQQPNPGF
jgi:hypothetical protein